ncbi:MAG: COG4705 family protein [Segniliparus sp.]|uniref:COG4705 family protein n=1 Tax=Segniliparus sp. TaxID=2804064 RepID=UPI003F322EA3
MTDTTRPSLATRRALSKVPEVTVWFWVVKILCATVGESFADWINMTLGFGLADTAVLFTVVLVAVMAWQLRLDRYVPAVYWLAVVVLSVAGTLYTDILTDALHVPLAVSTSVFAAVLAVVFGVWFARERTLSIHSIATLPRELFYWLAVLVAFALGTAVGDWTMELTGWGPGEAVLLPAGLIVLIVVGWRLGANAVLSFWLAYVLTRPLGANLGDWLASPRADHGLGLGTAATSVLFLAAILATVVRLTLTRGDVIEEAARAPAPVGVANPARERVMHGYYAAIAVCAVGLLVWANGRPHATASDEEESAPRSAARTLAPGQAAERFPPAEVAKFRAIAEDVLEKVRAGRQSEAKARVKELETVWDDDEKSLRPMDGAAWHVLDDQIDSALEALRADKPDPAAEARALDALLDSLRMP